LAEIGFNGVVPDVAAGLLFLLFMANDAVECFGLPKSSASFAKDQVRFARYVTFPVLNNDAQVGVVVRLNQSVDVVRHDNPFVEKVVLFMRGVQNFDGEVRDARVSKATGTFATVEVPFDALETFGLAVVLRSRLA
jgi:hypothetical protein